MGVDNFWNIFLNKVLPSPAAESDCLFLLSGRRCGRVHPVFRHWMTTTDIQADFQTYKRIQIDRWPQQCNVLQRLWKTTTVLSSAHQHCDVYPLKKKLFSSVSFRCDLFVQSYKLYIVWNEHIGFCIFLVWNVIGLKSIKIILPATLDALGIFLCLMICSLTLWRFNWIVMSSNNMFIVNKA